MEIANLQMPFVLLILVTVTDKYTNNIMIYHKGHEHSMALDAF